MMIFAVAIGRLMLALAIVAALSLIGHALLPPSLRPRRARFAVPLSLSFGALLVGWVVWVIGTLVGTTAAFIAAALLLAASLRGIRAWAAAVGRVAGEVGAIARREKVATALVLLVLLLLVPQLTVPLIDSDGLRYHVAFPKRFLMTGEISYYPYDAMSGLPQTAEMLYLLALPLGGGETAKMIHVLFLAATLTTLALTVRRRGVRMLAPFLFAASPVALGPAGAAFIDHIGLFHIAVALLLLRRPSHVPLPLAAAFATKVTVAPAVAALTLVTAKKSLKSWLITVAVVAVAFAPYAVRNVRHTGDPIHPLGRGLLRLPLEGISKESLAYATQFHSKIEGVVAIPWLAQPEVQDDEVVGLHHLVGLFALLLAIRHRRLRAPLAVVIAYLVICLVYRPPARYLLPMFLVLAWFEAVALSRLRRFAPIVALILAIPALSVSLRVALKQGSPLLYLRGMSRSNYLAAIVPGYRASEVINASGGEGTVMAVDYPAPYYFDRPWIVEGILNEPPLQRWVRESRSVDELMARLHRENVRYVVVTPGYGGGGPHTLVALATNQHEAELLAELRRRLVHTARIDSVDIFLVRN